MGCGDAKEKLEQEIMNIRITRIKIQYERHKQINLLKKNYNCDIKTSIIPDQNDQKLQREDKKRRTLSKNNDTKDHKSKDMRIGFKRSKSMVIKKQY